VWLRWLALTGNQGQAWLAKRGILLNKTAFFVDSFGVQTLSRELKEEEGRHHLSIHFRVQTNRGSVDHELVVPVPENQIPLVEKTIEGWGRI
jgi:hypothetical protein